MGLIRAINEIGFKAKIVGGAMVGIQATAIKRQLGPLLNGITNYETWVPAKTMEYPGVNEFLAKYQARAGAEGVDPLGYYLGTWGYAYAQLVEQAIKGANSLDDEKLAAYFRTATFKTIMGDVKFGDAGRVGRVALHRRAVPRHQGQRARPVQGHERADHRRPAAVRDRQAGLPLREREVAKRQVPGVRARGLMHTAGLPNRAALRRRGPTAARRRCRRLRAAT